METYRSQNSPSYSPPGVLFAFLGFLVFAFFIVYKWTDKVEVRELPGVGRLGLDAKVLGPRTVWSDVQIASRMATGAANPALGETLFKKWCIACHGEKGAGNGVLAAALNPPPRDFTKGRFRFRDTPQGSLPSDNDLFRTISAGMLPSRMPTFGFLSVEERWALVDEVKKLSEFFDDEEKKVFNYFKENPADPELVLSDVNITIDDDAVARGKKLYLEKGECWKCHGKEGLGNGPSASTLKAEEGFPIRAPNIRRGPAMLKSVASAKDVYRVLKVGISGTPMPSWENGVSSSEMRDLAAFTESLWKFEERGAIDRVQHGSVQLTGPQSIVELGQRLFLTNCAGCHGKAGRGDGVATDIMRVKPASLASGIFKYKSTPEGCFPDPADFKRTLRNGVGGSSMPAWNLHSESELDSLVAFLQSLSASRAPAGQVITIPPVPKEIVGTPESAERGKTVFTNTCVICHGKEGYGDGEFAVITRDYRGELIRPRNLREEALKYGSDPSSIFRTISYGFEGTPMPGFAAAFDEAQRWDLVSFVLSLRQETSLATGVK
ncbi:MAG: c-type cytochrome [Planctomycetes bacterium]|nr:c-type cytochrome [Planctomycetota bacterium]